MRYKVMFAAGLGLGYVLGTRAGRERYEQIVRATKRVSDSPAVQEAAGLVGARVSKMTVAAKDRVPFLRKDDAWDGETTAGPTGWPDPEVNRIT